MSQFDDWLLPEATPGSANAWRLQHTNEVDEFFVHDSYDAYYKRLGALLASINSGNASDAQVFLVGMRFDLDAIELTPGKLAVDLLVAAKAAGAQVRVLYSDDCRGKDALTGAAAEVEHDEQGHFHQKAAYLKIAGTAYLFVGGMDIALLRRGRWFDAMTEMRGRVTELGKLSLEERWASVRGSAFPVPSFLAAAGKSHTTFQFVRSYPPKSRSTAAGWPRAYDEDKSYGMLLERAIRKTQTLLYIEDQYFGETTVPPSLDDALIDAIRRKVNVVVVSGWWNGPRDMYIENNPRAMRKALVDKLNAIPADDRKTLTLLQPIAVDTTLPGYIHTKTWIFDDKLVVIGSANYWPVSFLGDDAELGVAIASELATKTSGGRPFGYGLRVQLWNRILKASGSPTIDLAKQPEIYQQLKVYTDGLEPLGTLWHGATPAEVPPP